jgi:hypothetical protein
LFLCFFVSSYSSSTSLPHLCMVLDDVAISEAYIQPRCIDASMH